MATDSESPAGTIVLPIGHYVGAYYPGPDEPLAHHTVRIGRAPVRLQSDEEFGLWALSHGLTGEDATHTWSREDVLSAATDADIQDAPRLLQELINEDIIVDVAPGTADSIDFAKSYRVVPLMFGVGMTSDDPVTAGIGLQGQPAVEVNSFGYELWRFGHRVGNLWDFGRIHGEALAEAAGASREETTPEQMLLHIFWELQPLLACNAVYLDVATDTPDQ
ncbi:MAG: hypothetical protein ACRDUA_06100 [Micromonosporaceae bacterium]